MGEIRTKIIDIDYDEIWSRYKNESETFKYLDGIYKEEGNVGIALYKWIFYSFLSQKSATSSVWHMNGFLKKLA